MNPFCAGHLTTRSRWPNHHLARRLGRRSPDDVAGEHRSGRCRICVDVRALLRAPVDVTEGSVAAHGLGGARGRYTGGPVLVRPAFRG